MKRSSVRLTLQVRQPDGELKPVELLVHPPNVETFTALTNERVWERIAEQDGKDKSGLFLEVFAALLSRTDKERGTAEWLRQNLEPDDLGLIVEAVGSLFGMERKTDPGEAKAP